MTVELKVRNLVIAALLGTCLVVGITCQFRFSSISRVNSECYAPATASDLPDGLAKVPSEVFVQQFPNGC